MSIEYVQHRVGNIRHIEIRHYPKTAVLHTEPAQQLMAALPKYLNQLSYNRPDSTPVIRELAKIPQILTGAVRQHKKHTTINVELQYLHPKPQQITTHFLDPSMSDFVAIPILFDRLIQTFHSQFYIRHYIQHEQDDMGDLLFDDGRFLEFLDLLWEGSYSECPHDDLSLLLHRYHVKTSRRIPVAPWDYGYDSHRAYLTRCEQRTELFQDVRNLLEPINENIANWNRAIVNNLQQTLLNMKLPEKYYRCPPEKPPEKKYVDATTIVQGKIIDDDSDDWAWSGSPANPPKNLYRFMPRLVKYWGT